MALPASRAMLYLPSELVDWPNGVPHLQRDDFPVPPLPALPHEFPFAPPISFGIDANDPASYNTRYEGTPTKFAARPLALAARATSKNAKTTTAKRSQGLHISNRTRLQFVYRSDEMWGRLIQYLTPAGQNLIDHPDPHVYDNVDRQLNNRPPNIPPLDDALPPLTINGWDTAPNTGWPLPGPAQQAQAIRSLVDHSYEQMRRGVPLVNCEDGVDSEYATQFLIPTNLLLQTRFGIPADTWAEQWDNIRDEFRPERHLISRGLYPYWGRGIREEQEKNIKAKGAAGFPDFLLYSKPLRTHHNAITEVKTWWTHSTSEIHGIWEQSDGPVEPDGMFQYWNKSTGAEVIKQVWGELHYFNARFGIWTNGEILAAFIKTGPNELTFSHTRAWTDPEAFLIVAAVSFAAVQSFADGVDIQTIIDEICPPASRRTPAQEGLA